MKNSAPGSIQQSNETTFAGAFVGSPVIVASAVCVLLLFSSLGGCAWVQLSPEAKGIGMADSATEVADCKRVGNVRAQTKSRIGFIQRNQDNVADELRSLARNEAVDLGADTIMAEGPPTPEGTQKFRAYRCSVNSTR